MSLSIVRLPSFPFKIADCVEQFLCGIVPDTRVRVRADGEHFGAMDLHSVGFCIERLGRAAIYLAAHCR